MVRGISLWEQGMDVTLDLSSLRPGCLQELGKCSLQPSEIYELVHVCACMYVCEHVCVCVHVSLGSQRGERMMVSSIGAETERAGRTAFWA